MNKSASNLWSAKWHTYRFSAAHCLPSFPSVRATRVHVFLTAPWECSALYSQITQSICLIWLLHGSLFVSGLACTSDGVEARRRSECAHDPPCRMCVLRRSGCVRSAGPTCVCVCMCLFFFLSVCLRASHCPDSNALSAGFLPAHHGLHIGCQCESDSLSYALRCANFSTWPCHARFPLVCSLSLHLLPLPLSLSLHLCSLDVDHLPSLFVNLNFASWNICLRFSCFSFHLSLSLPISRALTRLQRLNTLGIRFYTERLWNAIHLVKLWSTSQITACETSSYQFSSLLKQHRKGFRGPDPCRYLQNTFLFQIFAGWTDLH